MNHKTSPYGTWCCDLCNEIFRTRRDLYRHKDEKHPHPKGAWNKGRTVKDDPRIAKGANKVKEGYASGRLKGSWLGRKHTDEQKERISESMKRAHQEGRAHNIGECRWNNEHSWPEKWFIEVIANEFEDKDYQCELPFHRFALDFAWIKKKKCIEIDGNYHEKEDQKKRDFEKDKLLKEEGWQILRMPWKEVFAKPKEWIEKAKSFIHCK